MGKKKIKSSVEKNESVELRHITELVEPVCFNLVNNHNSPISVVDSEGKQMLTLQPQEVRYLEMIELQKFEKSEHFKNLVNRGILSIVEWQ